MVEMVSSLQLVDVPVGGRIKRGNLQESQQPGTTRAKYLDVGSDIESIFNPVDSGKKGYIDKPLSCVRCRKFFETIRFVTASNFDYFER